MSTDGTGQAAGEFAGVAAPGAVHGFRDSIVRGAAILGIVLALQVGAGPMVYRAFAPDVVQALREKTADPLDVLYVGDSTVTQYAPADDDKRSAPAYLSEQLADRDVSSYVHPAYDMRCFSAIASFLANQTNRPRNIVVPVNLRSFSPGWQRYPDYSFDRERRCLKNDSYFARAFHIPFDVFYQAPNDLAAYNAFPVFEQGNAVGTIASLRKEWRTADETRQLEISALMSYLQPVRDDHRLFAAIRDLIHTCEAADIELLVYVTPVDVETGDACTGGRVSAAAQAIVKEVSAICAEADVTLFDWSEAFPASYFIVGTGSIEDHLNETGRRALAGRIAEVLQSGRAADGPR